MSAGTSLDMRWSELVAAISLATDVGMAQPLESGLGTCLVATGLAERVGLDAADRQRVYHLALLQHIGCTAATSTVAAVMGDEMLMRAHAATLDFADRRQMLAFVLRHVARANPPLARPSALARALAGGARVNASVADVCEAARLLVGRFGYEPGFADDIERVLEYWDGTGFPGRAAGEAIPVAVRVVQVATLAVAAQREAGVDGAAALVRTRSGHSLGPAEAGVFLADPAGLLGPLHGPALWAEVITAEPVPSRMATDDDVDRALRTVADFVDLKAACLAGHSSGVADLAAEAAERMGLSGDEVVEVRRAGWVHDLGRLSVSAGIWEHPGPLTADQWERVRLHPYYTDRVLDRTPSLRRLSAVASAHHERPDGSGYFRRSGGAQLGLAARVLAAADAYHAMTEPRPYRDALSPQVAAKELRDGADAGRFDAAAVTAVLRAAGQAGGRRRSAAPDGLTAREVEILREVARGLSIKQIARRLGIAPKTADGHIQRIYTKLGVRTRAGATLYALQHGLLPAGEGVDVPKLGEISP